MLQLRNGFQISARTIGMTLLLTGALALPIDVPSAFAQPNYQSCGMIASACSGPNVSTQATKMIRNFTGPIMFAPTPAGCAMGCAVFGAPNANGCSASTFTGFIPTTVYVPRLSVVFLSASDTPGMGCDFDCGTRGKCSIRGADGLPVELMHFGVE